MMVIIPEGNYSINIIDYLRGMTGRMLLKSGIRERAISIHRLKIDADQIEPFKFLVKDYLESPDSYENERVILLFGNRSVSNRGIVTTHVSALFPATSTQRSHFDLHDP